MQCCCYQTEQNVVGVMELLFHCTEGAWELSEQASCHHLTSKWCSFSQYSSFIRSESDLQLVLHHVEGVVREVDLLNAVDDLLLRLGVDRLLPQLPQLLLQDDEDRGKLEIASN